MNRKHVGATLNKRLHHRNTFNYSSWQKLKLKRKARYSPWILLALIAIALLIYFLGFRNDNDDDNEEVQNITYVDTDTTATSTEGPVQNYIQYINETHTMGLDHNYTNGALQRLTDAISTKANEIGYDVKADLQQVKQEADQIQKDPFETTHAKSIRNAADILSKSMQNMQQAKYPALQNQMQEVRKAAATIDPDKLTLDQREAVKNFFEQSSQLLQNMN